MCWAGLGQNVHKVGSGLIFRADLSYKLAKGKEQFLLLCFFINIIYLYFYF